ncbi:twin transmembrane helix small protein [Prosthecomicrobium pneumaticum]|uniref:Na+-transporting NADH:ubiquinone oxidoreductase subunit NqrB n=1 Tax=Prosthecomicrobium pneumaticum TaxID=81895 RepID=A0A7W9FMX3_9HYPH|nr:twin transmembrane helix small protein [Prosthecomicrobium pneumaticum]MBB5753628.1 Na+-transporting NADH:ubiquinone oxidoreductase subunit NqrB [Prosthecomicrobium pneumaticum]
MSFWQIIIPVAMAAVVVVLLLGLFNMLRGGSPERSQSLMRWRVLLQALALGLMLLFLLVAAGGR